MKQSITILLAETQPIVREGFKRILQGSEFEDIAEASSGHEALEQVRVLDPEVVLLDLYLPPKGGLEILLELKHTKPELRVVMLGREPASALGVRALREGAGGYVTPDQTPEQLLDAIRRVHRGGRYVSPELAELLAVRLITGDAPARHERLSPREFDVMRRLAAGQTIGEIAAELNLSVKTVSTHRAHVLEKMEVRNNAEIAQYAMRQRLLD